MTPAGPPLGQLVARALRALRRDAALTLALAAACGVPLALLAAWVVGLLRPWSRPGFGPLALELFLVTAAAALVVLGVRRWLRSLDEAAVAAEAERQAGMPEGTVLGVLELTRQLPPGTSGALARRAELEVGRQLATIPPHRFDGELGRRVRRRRSAAAALLVGLTATVTALGFAAPDHSRAAWAPLATPVRNLSHPPLPPLAVQPGDARVDRGSDLRVRVQAPGRSVVTVRWRAEGDVVHEELGVVSGDTAALVIPRVTAVTEYWAESPDGALSQRYRITPVDPLLLSGLSVDVVYPPYVGRPADRFEGDVPPLDVPEGTQFVIRGRATRALAVAELTRASGEAVRLDVQGDAFSGTFTPSAGGIYAWRLVDGGGGSPAAAPSPLRIRVLQDAAPVVEIRFPASDTVLDASLRTAVVAEARDDHGVASATLTSWRVDRSGRRFPEVRTEIPLGGDEAALIRTLLDARRHELLPGDTLKFNITATDNSPRRQQGTSRTVSLRLPGMNELRERAVAEADELLRETESLARDAARIEQSARTLERRTAAANARRSADRQRSPGRQGERAAAEQRQRMDHSEAAPARQLLEEQQALLERLDAMERQLERLERAMEEAGLRDAELRERLAELRALQEELVTPELKKQLEQLRRALEELDPEELQAALDAMARQQEQTREQLERSLEAMRRAADEQRVNNLAQEARELATRQQALSQAMAEGTPTPEQAEAQRELAEQARDLARELAAMQKRLEEHGDAGAAEQLGEAGRDVQQAGQRMEQAAQDAARRDGAGAAERGEQAAAQLERTADALEQTRRAMAEARRQDAQDSVQQAASDALALAERQQELLERMREGEEQADSAGRSPDYEVIDPRSPPVPRLPQLPQPQARIGSRGERDQPPPSPSGTRPEPGQQQGGQQQGGQQQGGQQQGGQQQGGQQQGGQQQGGQQQGGQQQGGQQQGGQQQGGRQAGGQQQAGGGQQGGQGRQGAGQQAAPGAAQGGTGRGRSSGESLRSDQAALQQGLQQLNRNLQEAAQRSGAVTREVSGAMARANRDMQQTLEALQRGESGTQQAQQTVESLNRLALALLNSAGNSGGPEGGSGSQQALPQLADLARQQGSLAGQSGSLAPMSLSDGAMSRQLERLAAEQMEIAKRLGSLSAPDGDEGAADVDSLAREAEAIARLLGTGRLTQDAIMRQERLFHRLLDAGRTLEKDELDEERAGSAPGSFTPRDVPGLDPRLLEQLERFRMPSAEELRALPPAYRRLILDYFERLNRPAPPTAGSAPAARDAR